MSSSDNMLTYQYLRRNLPREPMTPSAPLYETMPCGDAHGITRHVDQKEVIPLCASTPSPYDDAKNRLRVEAEIKKAQLRKEQVMSERQILEEEFKAKIMLIDAETELILNSIDGAKEVPSTSSAITINGVDSEGRKKTVSNRALRTGETNAGRIDRPLETPEPKGLKQLGMLGCLSIRQLVSPSLDESYEVVAPGNVVILRAILSFDVANTILLGQKTFVYLDIFDSEGNKVVIQLINFHSGSSDTMELVVNRKLACLIRKASTLIKPMLKIHDVNGRPVLKVKGPGMRGDRNVFLVQTINKANIGSLDLAPVRLSPSYVACNHTAVTFPSKLHVNLKAAIVACSFLVVSKSIAKYREHKIQESAQPVHKVSVE